MAAYEKPVTVYQVTGFYIVLFLNEPVRERRRQRAGGHGYRGGHRRPGRFFSKYPISRR